MARLAELVQKEELFVSGHTLCPGCPLPIIMKIVLKATDEPVVIANATGCLQHASARYPFTSWRVNWIHTTTGGAAAVVSGIETAFKQFKKKGQIPVDKDIKFIVIAGDGATGDIGLSAFSGAIERGHNFVYICYDNQTYCRSGGMRSSTSMIGTATTSTPGAGLIPGKMEVRKDITQIIAAHKNIYIAQSSVWKWQDLYKKAKQAFAFSGPSFINILTPCPQQWQIKPETVIDVARIASDTCIWPLYEIFPDQKLAINYKPINKKTIVEWFQLQGRFSHLLKPENKWLVDKIQNEINQEWDTLLFLENKTKGH